MSKTFAHFPTPSVNVLALGDPKIFSYQKIKSLKGKATVASLGRGRERWAWRVLLLRVLVCLHVQASFVCCIPSGVGQPESWLSARAAGRASWGNKVNPRAPSAPKQSQVRPPQNSDGDSAL